MNIKEKRLELGMTQAAFAKLLGVSRESIAKWEVGAANPKTEALPQIADILGCSIDELFGRVPAGEDDTQKTPGDSPAE